MPHYSVPITLADGRPRRLRYDWNALEALEETAGITIDSLKDIMSDPRQRLRNIRHIMWAGLLHEDETLTPKAVGAIMTPLSEMAEWVERITTAFRLAFGDAAGDQKNPEAPAPETTAPAAAGTGDAT